MTQPADILAPAIGACLSCRQLFLVTPETPNCVLCGQPPAYTLPFSHAPRPLITREEAIGHLEELGQSREEAEKTLGPEGPPAEPIPEAVPPEEPSPAAEESPGAAGEELAEGLAPAGSKPILALFRGIHDFLGGIVEYPEQLRDLFLEAHAEAEETSNAIGRLVAVRDLVDSLWERFESPPAEPAEPQPAPPADEG